MTCPWVREDGAYLLGALSADERHAYEEHIAGCASCAAALAEVAGLPGLLSRLPPEAVEAVKAVGSSTPPLPADLLPTLLVAVRSERGRSRRRLRVASALATAAAAVAVVLLVPVLTPSSRQPSQVALARVGQVPISATAALVDKTWGTQIELRCTYTGSTQYSPDSYFLVATDRTGHSEQVATWRVISGKQIKITAATALHKSDLAELEVRTPTGVPVLRLRT